MLFYSSKKYTSDKNGVITVNRFFGSTSIIVDGCLETGPYLIDMWKHVFKRLPKKITPNKILILGLGGGNVVAILQKKYPGSEIHVIEWDDVMISIAKEYKLFRMTSKIKIQNEDFFKLLPYIKDTFDIIIVDLFTGKVPPLDITHQETIGGLKAILAPAGYLFTNFYSHSHYSDFFEKSFKQNRTWKYKYNTLGLYRE